ncbi:diguanylate cyclase domain-containing protein [Kineococcus sp. TBRC 1896]|uniref:Diguanylate cyclase domain-containing protein n=1 Tax=Kineococcus mangrovi TaxID=1660183 RepID=A0ABV4I792_9ACTN
MSSDQSAGRGRLVEAPGEPAALSGGVWRRRLVFCAVFTLATLLGRGGQADGAHLAILWPASAVGLLWLAGSPGRAGRVVDALLVLVLTLGLRRVTGMPLGESAVLSVAAVVQALAGTWTYRVLQPSGFRLARVQHLRSLALSSSSGAVLSSPVAAVAFALVDDVPAPLATAQWALRTAVSTFVVLAIVLRSAERGARSPGSSTRALERAAQAVVFLAAYGIAFGLLRGTAVAFLVLPVAVWVALRRTTTAATVHVVQASAVVVVVTWAGRGPWSGLDPDLQAVCAEAFIGTLAFLTLVLALYRDESIENARRAAEQAGLLNAVFASISDAVCVFDRQGNSLLRNPAADDLLGGPRVDRREWGRAVTFHHPDGAPFADAELPVVRALAGEAVVGVDLRLHRSGDPEGVLVNVSAQPLPREDGAVWGGGVVAAFHDVTEVRAATARVAQAHELLANVLRGATEHAIVAVDTAGVVTVFSEGAQRMLGWTEQEMLGGDGLALHDPAEVQAVAAALGLTDPRQIFAAAVSDEPTTGRFTYVRRDGSTLPVVLTTSPMRDHAGELVGWIGMATDVSELENSEALFRAALETAPVGIALVAATGERAGRVLRVNRSLCRFTGRCEEELLGAEFAGLALDAAPFEELFADVLGRRREQRVVLRFRAPDGRRLDAEVTGTLVRPVGGEVTLLLLVEDVTERLAAESELQHRALHDALTGLPNRVLFHDRLEHAVTAARRGTGHVGLLYVDLDGFKAVNDGAGHDAGDDLLVQVAQLLTSCVRPGDTVARLGGDEFAIVCAGTTAEEDLVAIGARVLEALRVPFDVRGRDGRSVRAVVGASIGVRWCDGDGDVPAEELLRDADDAMYAAKRAGKGRVVVHRGRGGTECVPGASHLSVG